MSVNHGREDRMTMTVRAGEIASLLDRVPGDVTVLSLDCFDTLMWRNVHEPHDVFARIPGQGGAVEPRQWAERVARRMRHLNTQSAEVTLDDIYRRMLPGASPERIADAVAHELSLEASHLFPFAPTVELMRAAKARGMTIVIVSDMYLTEAQLRDLLAHAAGDEIMGMIDHVFMSSAHDTSKAAGLFPIVLKALGVAPQQVVHLGDNIDADYHGAIRAGIHAVHFRQFDDETVQRLRLEANAGAMLDPEIRVTQPAWQPHRPAIALRAHDDPAYVVGHDVMGPVMHAFSVWLKGEIDAMAARLGKPVRPLFLMRDGYLPYRVFDALYPEAGSQAVEISRMTAARASFTSREVVEAFLDEYLYTVPHKAMARQLNLLASEVEPMLRDTRSDRAFLKAIRSEPFMRKIIKRSTNFCERFKAHLAAHGVRPRDAVMLVDVGYKGTVQNIVTPFLADQMQLEIAGRYVFMREETLSTLDKQGLIGTDVYPCRAVNGMATCVGVIEQMCNIAQGSTVDYTPEGAPVREDSGFKGEQNATRDRIQQACLDFALTSGAAMHRAPDSDDIASRRRMAAAIIQRLMYFPQPREVTLFADFHHDVNLGTKAMVSMLDVDVAARGLRRRGLAYVNDSRRMFMPGEVAPHGLAYLMAMATQTTLGLDIRSTDFDVGGIDVPVLLLGATEQAVVPIKAWPTHEGYYRITVPTGLNRPTVAVQLGAAFASVQLDRAFWAPIKSFKGDQETGMIAVEPILDGMTMLADGIYAASETGVVVVPPHDQKQSHALTLLFRPLQRREAALQQKVAA